MRYLPAFSFNNESHILTGRCKSSYRYFHFVFSPPPPHIYLPFPFRDVSSYYQYYSALLIYFRPSRPKCNALSYFLPTASYHSADPVISQQMNVFRDERWSSSWLCFTNEDQGMNKGSSSIASLLDDQPSLFDWRVIWNKDWLRLWITQQGLTCRKTSDLSVRLKIHCVCW